MKKADKIDCNIFAVTFIVPGGLKLMNYDLYRGLNTDIAHIRINTHNSEYSITEPIVDPDSQNIIFGSNYKLFIVDYKLRRIKTYTLKQLGIYDSDASLSGAMAISEKNLYFFISHDRKDHLYKVPLTMDMPAVNIHNLVWSYDDRKVTDKSIKDGTRFDIRSKFLSPYNGLINIPYNLAAPNYSKLQEYESFDYHPEYGWLFSSPITERYPWYDDYFITYIDSLNVMKKISHGVVARWSYNGNVVFLRKPFRLFAVDMKSKKKRVVLRVNANLDYSLNGGYAPVQDYQRRFYAIRCSVGRSRGHIVVCDLLKKSYKLISPNNLIEFCILTDSSNLYHPATNDIMFSVEE